MSSDAHALIQKYGLRAKKSWGQNFLVDERAYREIVHACAIGAGDWVVEIGAGLGTLTRRLADTGAHVVAIERERDMLEVLRAELGSDARIEVVEANALTFDYPSVAPRAGRPPIVVGNLPYQIASPILFRLLEARASIARIVVMLQKEMADRIVAPPGEKSYGALSVMVRLYGEPKLVCRVRAGGFVPAPRVDSAVLRIVPRAQPLDVGEQQFSRVVHAAFGQRRKTLRNALSAAFEMALVDRALGGAGIDGKRRGETLSIVEFAALTRAFDA
ncbi:MAG: 16S rRNA (adenine(1518)-N(6)/adenine(1519)-N(6))-dimethyltransferase RsmA [Polyangia bacterium]